MKKDWFIAKLAKNSKEAKKITINQQPLTSIPYQAEYRDFMMIFLQNSNTGRVEVDNVAQIGDVAWSSIRNLFTTLAAELPLVLAGILVLVIFYVLARVLRALFWKTTQRTKIDHRLRILISRMIVVVVVTLGIFTSLTVIVPSFNFGSLIAGVGFTSVVLGFATKDILNNFLSGILILWQQPFQIGDHLFVGKESGKVEFIGVRATSLRKDDGELILIPNGDMYSSALTIRGAGAKRRMSLKFNLGYDADIERAKEITYQALGDTTGVLAEPRPNVYVSDLTSDGVNVTANFWINTNESKPLKVFDLAAIAILTALDRNEIEPFPPGSMIVQSPKEEATSEEPEEAQIAGQ